MTITQQLEEWLESDDEKVQEELDKTILSGKWLAEKLQEHSFDAEFAIGFAQDFLEYVGQNLRGYDT